ncbi:MAG: WD40 repeat domain-containing protein, partial [Prevotella sp.]|nr:WD40 repeat domain-containing protein [Prevotella sp.]
AVRQSEIAQAMTLRSEQERQKALKAQAAAEASAQEAHESYQMAESQRLEAEEQRRQAEHAKQVAETLNYISLARTLGSQSYSIYMSGDAELGTMLAYVAYLFTKEHHGDLYTPSVFQALTKSSGGQLDWNIHKGSISRIEFFPQSNKLLSVSIYGEIFTHELQNDQLVTKRLLNDNSYCFRDAVATKTTGYAISHTGHLVVIGHDKPEIIYQEDVLKPFSLQLMNDAQQLLIVGRNSLAVFDIATHKIISTRKLPFNVVCTGRYDYKPLLFDDQGRSHLVNSIDNFTTTKIAVPGQVTAFASSKNEHLMAYGMADGTIYMIDKHNKTSKLLGHLSQVTKMKFNGRRLYSSSYDGKLLFWFINDDQVNPITLFQSNSWLTDFTFDKNKEFVWTGEANGTLKQYLISLSLIGKRIEKNVKRNLTQEEWNYYVGKGIPYRALKETTPEDYN